MVFEIGRVCVKLSGRDAGQTCIVVDAIDNRFVIIDGNTRRRKCNISHLMPTEKTLKIDKKATTGEVKELLSELGVKIKPVTKPRKVGSKPVKVRKSKKAKEKPAKKEAKSKK
jgi:large subunit ribosomal protein L14e